MGQVERGTWETTQPKPDLRLSEQVEYRELGQGLPVPSVVGGLVEVLSRSDLVDFAPYKYL